MSSQHELDSASLRAVAGLFPMIMAFDSNADEGSEFVRVAFLVPKHITCSLVSDKAYQLVASLTI